MPFAWIGTVADAPQVSTAFSVGALGVEGMTTEPCERGD
jgi:hypothetical protein